MASGNKKGKFTIQDGWAAPGTGKYFYDFGFGLTSATVVFFVVESFVASDNVFAFELLAIQVVAAAIFFWIRRAIYSVKK